jgi:CRISPR-associated protein Csb2
MTLILEIEYLSGVAFAAIGPDSPIPDWPPQPDRIFSALVATWAAQGQGGREAEALEWLEALPPPRILASDGEPRTAPQVYVPPNDYETPNGELSKLKWYRDFLSKKVSPPEKGGHKKLWHQAWNVIPDQRKRSGLKERNFPATRPHKPVIRLFWNDVVLKDEIFTALQRLASDTAYVGHSASLTRCHFLLHHDRPGVGEAKSPERRVYAGRFAELRQTFEAGRRPLPGARAAPVSEAKLERTSLFGKRWLILEHVEGDMPDIRACALVSKIIRDALLSGYQRIGLGNDIPEIISGHAPDGTPTRAPHLAVAPLSFTGFPYADGHLMGFALVPPQNSAILEDESLRKVLRTLAPIDEERGRRVLTLTTKEGTPSDRAFSVGLSPTFEPPTGKHSLDPALYTRSSQAFATVTPIALDRHLKEKGEARLAEIAAQIASACRNIDLPEPEEIVADKHSAIEGAPSAYPSGKSPAWMRWRLPQSLASRQLTHAVIRFAHPVEGPVILGAGRFIGLGLFRPLDKEER